MNQCPTCMGWVNPLEALDTDEGRYHDRLDCLTEGRFEELVAKYGCKCEVAATFTQAGWIEHLDEEHATDPAYRAPSECVYWAGRLDKDGYGRFGQDLAHRLVYEGIIGPIPEGTEIDHLCRNRACVNTDHLQPVSHRENTLRGETIAARYAARTHCKNGHEFSDENTLPTKDGWRRCRECNRQDLARRRHSRPLDVGGMVSGEIPGQGSRASHETPPTLIPGQYDSDDLDRIVSKSMRRREQASWQELGRWLDGKLNKAALDAEEWFD